MLKKSQRISTNRVSWLLKKGLPLSNNFFSAKFHLNKAPQSRYSVVVSKKIEPLATDRNLLRRQLYEILRDLPLSSSNIDCILIVKPALASLNFADKKTALINTLQQITSKLN
jgi:ribonuclease P protein component